MRENRGFTLIELAIVIAIIGILAAVAVPRFTSLNKQAEITSTQKFLSSLQTSAAIYVAQSHYAPIIFSDFVTTGNAIPPYTLSTRQLMTDGHITAMTPANLTATNLQVDLRCGDSVYFYLNGTDVTAVFPP